ncbi:MAG TPA: phosphatidylserine/phosphatidylglycerophosphate/cardiolipin synthase family protein [Candidatus Paceibacterota bacterium]|nr:phosphatidylserine/phosphatidylglycerophosphate/cardiolipin synthase family protein [Verrucomicrobiota bacterium]HSA09029.1 phosphatidylserine/phosphatidylglycerophosphate/cardiolipin synthase family protein [Candidatus Paceibacterota bacterium]
MFSGSSARHITAAALAALMLLADVAGRPASAAAPRQQALDEWRSLTAPSAPMPRVFVKGDRLRFYFQTPTSVEEFSARWSRHRIPNEGYQVSSAVLRWHKKLARMPAGERDWREATVVADAEWRRLATNLVEVLTPASPGHGIYYQGLQDERLLYRDAQGSPRFSSAGDQPEGVIIDRHLSMEDTIGTLARSVEQDLTRSYPGKSLFLLLAPDARRFPQALLLDRKRGQCVWLVPAAYYDATERGLGLSATAQGVSALLFESHGLALVKNPVSSLVRLGDLGLQTVVRFVRFPYPKPSYRYPPADRSQGMDLAQWEDWLDRYTGTRQLDGALDLLIDGERFFPRLKQAIANATNHIHFDIYIFDKDDVGVAVADQLKARSRQIEVKVILDRLGTISGGMVPPGTPLPEGFVLPNSICSYLKQDSRVRVRPFLNPWFSSDHTKVLLVDGTHAWIGGMNLGREYRFEWHDLMVELQGPVVATLEDEFRRDWAHEGLLGDFGYVAELTRGPRKPPASRPEDRWIQLRLLPTKTLWKPFNSAVQHAIAKAKSYIYLEHPYLFDKRVIIALVRARNRGVDVRVVLPRVNDLKSGGRSNLVVANYLLEHGVRVYFYPGMTHVKALMVDDWACVGSANLNHLSLRVCQEQNVATSDPAFAARLKRELFEEDFATSYELTEPVTTEWIDFLVDLLLKGV